MLWEGAWIANKLLQPVQQLCNICPTWCHSVFQHLLLWKPQAFFLHTSVVMIPSTLHAHKLWRAFLLQKQALLLHSENLKDLHNPTATSEKLTGRFAACHERFMILIGAQASSDNPQGL